MTPPVRAVFFDVDFTLIYPGPIFQGEGYARFCSQHGIAVEPHRFERAVLAASSILNEEQDHIYDTRTFVRYTRRIIEEMGGTGDRLDACARDIYAEWAASQHFFLYHRDAGTSGAGTPESEGRVDLELPPLPRVVPAALRATGAYRGRGIWFRSRLRQASPKHLPGGAAASRR